MKSVRRMRYSFGARNRIPWREAVPAVGTAAISSAPAGFELNRGWFSERVVDFDMWLVCGGRAELVGSSGEKWELARGSVVCLRPGGAVSLKVLAPGPYVNIFAHFDFFDRDGKKIPPSLLDLPLVVTHAADVTFFEAAMRQILALDYGGNGEENGLRKELQSQIIRCLLLSLACAGEGPPNHAGRVVSAALSWFARDPGMSVGVSDLARHSGYSQRHFSRIFHAATGKSPRLAMKEIRIDQARKLLETTALSVSQISDGLGYSSVFYFSKQFKAVAGLSPSRYRARVTLLARGRESCRGRLA